MAKEPDKICPTCGQVTPKRVILSRQYKEHKDNLGSIDNRTGHFLSWGSGDYEGFALIDFRPWGGRRIYVPTGAIVWMDR